MLQLKRVSVLAEKLCSFYYVARIRSILTYTYCIPAFYSMLCDNHLKFLKQVQKICTKIILPDTESNHERLKYLIPELRIFSENYIEITF